MYAKNLRFPCAVCREDAVLKTYNRRKESMKKRILSLILVVVMLALTLTSCSYSFAEDNMSNYVDLDATAFKDALQKLVIEDGDFTTDEEIRAQKVEETIRSIIGGKADLTKKLYEGSVGAYDILYYAYYCTADFEDAEDVILYASNMKESSAVKLQLGITSSASVLDKAIAEALKEKDIKDYLYKTDAATTTELKAGDVVYLTYTYDYVDANGTTKTFKATYEKMTLGEDEFSQKIISECKKVGVKKDFEIGEDADKRTYKNVVVDWTVVSENELGEFLIKDLDEVIADYDADATKVTDINGTSRYLKDAKDGLTYHVYPVYFVKADDFTAAYVLGTLLGKSITAETLEVFGDESYKATVDGRDVKLSILVAELAALCSTRDSAKTSLSSAESTLSTKKSALEAAGDNATEAQKTAVTEAQAAVDTAKTAYDEAVAKVDEKIETILSTGEDIETKILEEYRELQYDNLENAYNSEIFMNAAEVIWALIDKSVTVKSYPEKALEEMYERILDQHEYTFYTGTKDSTNKISYYSHYNGSFDAYLIETFAKNKTKAEALAAVREEAKKALDPIVKIYAVSEVFECVVSDKEFKNDFIKVNASYDSYVDQYGELNVRTAYQFNTLLYEILDVETYEKDEGDHKEGDMKEYVDGKLPFKNIKYEIKTEEEEAENE